MRYFMADKTATISTKLYIRIDGTAVPNTLEH